MEITFISRKFKGYIPSGIGARSIPVSRQASRLAGRPAGRQNFNSVQKFKNSVVGKLSKIWLV